MIRALLFDCNGVIIDDEPIHLKLFQKVLKEEGLQLTKEDYFKKYLALDDRTCFEDALRHHGHRATKTRVDELIQRKARYYQKVVRKEFRLFPGVKNFVKRYKNQYLLAVVSGALRNEIHWILEKSKFRQAFSAIVSAEDVKRSKPYPDCYKIALQKIRKFQGYRNLKAKECLAIEDSIHGVESAQKAGMYCLALTNSYSKNDLKKADFVVRSLAGLNLEKLLKSRF